MLLRHKLKPARTSVFQVLTPNGPLKIRAKSLAELVNIIIELRPNTVIGSNNGEVFIGDRHGLLFKVSRW